MIIYFSKTDRIMPKYLQLRTIGTLILLKLVTPILQHYINEQMNNVLGYCHRL